MFLCKSNLFIEKMSYKLVFSKNEFNIKSFKAKKGTTLFKTRIHYKKINSYFFSIKSEYIYILKRQV